MEVDLKPGVGRRSRSSSSSLNSNLGSSGNGRRVRTRGGELQAAEANPSPLGRQKKECVF